MTPMEKESRLQVGGLARKGRRPMIAIAAKMAVLLVAAYIILTTFMPDSMPDLYAKIDPMSKTMSSHQHGSSTPSIGTGSRPVAKLPLQIHIMSKCPDARDCIEKLIVPTMANVSEQVNFSIDYIGSFNGTDPVCMHGDQECQGNIIELCASETATNQTVALAFTSCMTREYFKVPQEELVIECTKAAGLSTDKLQECVSRDGGKYGLKLLEESFSRSKSAGVIRSCTVRLQQEIWCIRDGGRWKDCPNGSDPEHLIRDVGSRTGAE